MVRSAGLVVMLVFYACIDARLVTLHNDQPRFDQNQEILDAHDGCMIRFNGTYYLYGTVYNNQNGLSPYNGIACYSSPDMENWTNHGDILPERQLQDGLYWGVYYRPHVIYNKRTHKYVLFYNWLPWGAGFSGAYLAVALSDNPWGPFVIANARAVNTGDFAVFADDDSTGYVVYGFHSGSVGKLSADYTQVVSTLTLVGSGEAWGMFKRNGKYYVVGGNTCCFCYPGAPANVFMSSLPGGPYSNAGVLTGVEAQHAFEAELATATGSQFIYAGDMWGHTPSGYPALKGNDILYFGGPLSFNDSGYVSALPAFQSSWSIDLAEGQASSGPATPRNLAVGKTVTVSSTQEGSGWSSVFLTDGRKYSQTEFMGWKSANAGQPDHPEWIQVDLGALYPVQEVALFPKVKTAAYGCDAGLTQDINAGEGFPVDFSIQLSRNGTDWTTIVVKTGFPNPGSMAQRFKVGTDSARYVRVTATRLPSLLGVYRLQLAEIGVYNGLFPAQSALRMDKYFLAFSQDTNALVPEDPLVNVANEDSVPILSATPGASWLQVTITGSGNHQQIHHRVDWSKLSAGQTTYSTRVSVSAPGYIGTSYAVMAWIGNGLNLAFKKPVFTSSSMSSAWAAANLVDGQTYSNGSSNGWSSSSSTTVNHTEWAGVDLTGAFSIDRIKLYCRTDGTPGTGFPVDFTIQIALDSAGPWTTVISRTDFPKPSAPQLFTFPEQSARYVKIVGTRLQLIGTEYRMQLAEMEVFGKGLMTEVSDEAVVSEEVAVKAYPNPFNPTVNIDFVLPARASASYRIYAADGRLIYHTVLSSESQLSKKRLVWKGCDDHGNKVPSGAYVGYLAYETGKILSHKLMLLK